MRDLLARSSEYKNVVKYLSKRDANKLTSAVTQFDAVRVFEDKDRTQNIEIERKKLFEVLDELEKVYKAKLALLTSANKAAGQPSLLKRAWDNKGRLVVSAFVATACVVSAVKYFRG